MASGARRMQISLAALPGWMLPPGLLAAGVGAYPTWRAAGAGGLSALLAAGATVTGVSVCVAVVVRRFAARSPGAAAYAFILAGLIGMMACLVLSGLEWQVLDLHGPALLIWTAVFYTVLLLGQAAWLARALRHDDLRARPGEAHPRDPLSGTDA